ncbi:MAG: CoA transferase [Deltaproteobacteria bacterium]|nr:MAG: CoA transferase [Deltaproteobacteria bacterium]
MAGQALSDLRVLEYSDLVSGPYCAKLLADLGADVIKIEAPRIGDSARRRGPFLNDRPGPERSGLFFYLNTNKRGITLNLESKAGQGIFKELIKETDILIEDRLQRAMLSLGLDYDSLREINPELIQTSITPFGQTGPYRDYKAYHLNTYHSGLGYVTPGNAPSLDKEPLKTGGFVGEYASGLSAAVATLAALHWKGKTGAGQFIDVSKQEALINLQRVRAVAYPNSGKVFRRLAVVSGTGGLIECKDGYVMATLPEAHQWQGFAKLLNRPDLADEKYNDTEYRNEHWKEKIAPAISKFASQKTKEELYHKGQELGCPIVPVNSPADVVNSRQLKDRGFLVEADMHGEGKIRYPAAPYKLSVTPWREGTAPILGQHNEDVYRGLGYSKKDILKMSEDGVI